MVIGEYVMGVVDGVASNGYMVGEGDIDAFGGLVGKGAVFNQHAIIILINIVTLVIEADIAVDEFAVSKLIISV